MKLDALGKLALELDAIYKEREPVAPLTRLRIGGRPLFYIKPPSWESLPEVLRFLDRENIPFRILGRGTNLLVSDGDLGFGVLHILRMGGTVSVEGTTCEAGADLLLQEVARETFSHSVAGMEPLYLIPGSVGGAAYMNAGASGRSIFSFVRKVVVIDWKGNEKELGAGDIDFGYRRTNLAEIGLVKKVVLELRKGRAPEIEAKLKEYQKRRDETQPWKERTAGSVFKNPEGDHAGRILEELGFKGRRFGGACFSDIHANFLINCGTASFDDAFSLTERARTEALSRGYRLEYEMEVWR